MRSPYLLVDFPPHFNFQKKFKLKFKLQLETRDQYTGTATASMSRQLLRVSVAQLAVNSASAFEASNCIYLVFCIHVFLASRFKLPELYDSLLLIGYAHNNSASDPAVAV